MLLASVHNSLNDLNVLVEQLSDSEYSEICPELNATIGEHTRHIIEMFQCLQEFYDAGVVNYDNRARNVLIQNHTDHALAAIQAIQQNLDKPDKDIELQQVINGEEIKIKTNYNRELLYNLEHCIHHQALIKVALLQCNHITVDANFGIATSTIEYRNKCAQ